MTTKTIEKAPGAETIPVKTTLFPTLLDPWAQFSRMRNLMDEMMTEFFRPETRLRVFRETFRPELNLYKHDGHLVLEAAMPGLKKEDIDITLTGDTLTLHGHRKVEKKLEEAHYFCSEMREGHFTSSIRLPIDVVPNKVTAEYKDGILKLTMPMVEPEKHKTVNVKIQ